MAIAMECIYWAVLVCINLPQCCVMLTLCSYNFDFMAMFCCLCSLQVLVCVGTTVVGSAGKEQLKGIADKFEDVIVFMDPDHEGRTIRNKLEEWIGPTRHAFMPLPALGVGSSSAAGFKTGVQYAPAEATRKALFSACTSDREREEFRREDLEDMGLVQPNGVRGVNVKLRRKEFCAFLGLGPCDGRQLLKQLNWYGFSRSQAAEAAAYSQRCVDAWVLAHGSKEDSQ
ncbi:unnamed protein product [Ostreobium quekettii]|uniref:Ribonuclease M5 C-terminal domain-containing protein n=1 Tax=Ostreobium quekettii TaxID=121088 RepID=A0A8S1J6K0_9CHLO|nr:unnamed protein product [Ostreobium quekettii]